MKKVFSLFAAMLVAFGMSAQTTLIDYQSNAELPAGVAITGTTIQTTAKIHNNTDAVNVLQLKNGYTKSGVFTDSCIVLTYEGGFKAGDTLIVAGFINNADATKRGAVSVFTVAEGACSAKWTSSDFINGQTSADDPAAQTYVLEEDMDVIRLGRDGNTGTNLMLIQVVRPENQAGPTMETVYFVDHLGAATINVHAWGGTAAGTTWPGLPATKEAAQINGWDIYSFTAEAGAYANCIFNGGGKQTGDLVWTPGKYWFQEANAWVEASAITPKPAPTDPTTKDYYIKGAFDGNAWDHFVAMTPSEDRKDWTYTVIMGQYNGVNIADNAAGTDAGWYPTNSFAEGSDVFEAGDEVTFTYDCVANTILAKKTVVATGVTYELNGGMFNDYNWTCAADMFNDFMIDGGVTDFPTLDEYKAMANPYSGSGIAAKFTAAAAAQVYGMEKWATLKAYIMTTQNAQHDAESSIFALPEDVSTGAAQWRYATACFFVEGQYTSWPKAADFTACGVNSALWKAAWGQAWANPASVEADYTLAEPAKEGYTFDGWYANADFSGDKVTVLTPGMTGTLYAKWIEYISTTAEVAAMEDNTECKVSGVVTYVRSGNVYIQDGFGGMLVYLTSGATAPTVGQKVIVSGLKVTYNGAPEVKNAIITASESAELPAAQLKTLAEVKNSGLTLFGQRVKVEGVKIAKYDDKGNAYVAANGDTLQCYYMVLDQTAFPVGVKVNLTAIVGYYKGTVQFVGDIAGFEVVTLGKKEAYNYPARVDNRMTLENKWLITNVEDNFSANKPAGNDMARAMVAKNGIMYFPDREHVQLTRVDAATGEMLDPIAITGEHLFEAADAEGAYAAATTLPFNDLKIDNAGHLLLGACVSGGQHFMVYKVDETTGAATLVVDERLYDNEDFGEELQGQATAWRFDAFGVYGDVDNSAIIMGADANSFNVYKWTIENGMAGKAEKIDASLDPENDLSLLVKDGAVSVANFGTAPQIFPISDEYFYVDGWNTLPMLYDMDGVLVDDFINCPTGVTVVNNEGDTCKLNQGHNGLCEFEVNGEYFIVMAATNTVGTPNSAFALYKFADEARSFDGMEPLWYFPAAGMGAATNGCRTAVPSVEVNAETGVATIYVYTNQNGYGVYEMTVTPATGINDVEAAGVVTKVVRNNQVVIIKNGVHYNVLGTIIK